MDALGEAGEFIRSVGISLGKWVFIIVTCFHLQDQMMTFLTKSLIKMGVPAKGESCISSPDGRLPRPVGSPTFPIPAEDGEKGQGPGQRARTSGGDICTPTAGMQSWLQWRHRREPVSCHFVFPSGTVVKNSPVSAEDVGDPGSIPGSGRSPGRGDGNPLQYSCLENSMDKGIWQATVHGVAKNQTLLKD